MYNNLAVTQQSINALMSHEVDKLLVFMDASNNDLSEVCALHAK